MPRKSILDDFARARGEPRAPEAAPVAASPEVEWSRRKRIASGIFLVLGIAAAVGASAVMASTACDDDTGFGAVGFLLVVTPICLALAAGLAVKRAAPWGLFAGCFVWLISGALLLVTVYAIAFNVPCA